MRLGLAGLALVACKSGPTAADPTDPATATDPPTDTDPPAPTDPPTDTALPTDTDTPPTAAVHPAAVQVQVGVPTELTADAPGATELTWSATSTSAPGTDCSSLLSATDGSPVTLTVTGHTSALCADTLEVRLVASNAAGQAESTATIEVVPTPGRVTTFTELPGNPQPAIGTCPTWDCLNHADPTLGRLPNGDLALWFAAGGDQAAGLPVVGRAVQSAGSWTLDAGPVMLPTDAGPDAWDTARETPSVRWNAAAGAWDIWYLGYNISYFDDPAIGQARSTDATGTVWPRPDDPIYRAAAGSWDASFLTSPGALLGSDGVWRLYYSGASFAVDAGLMKVGVLTSTDGQTWTAHPNNPVFEGVDGAWDASILDPHVQFVGGRYVLWYSALDGQLTADSPISVGVATSEDGFTWTRIGTAPILGAAPGDWRDLRFLDVEVLVEPDGSLLLAGYGLSATSPNPDFPDFRPGRIGLFSSP